ncbi:MAG TPA: hypothetical protein VFZ73_11745 [Gemmatimonadaceae bacterium]
MFKLLGVAVAVYTVYAIMRGEVHAKDGPGGRIVSRVRSPEYFWMVVVTYSALAIALLTVF